MAYADKNEFVTDYRAAAGLAKTAYGAFYKDVSEDIAWDAYSNSAKGTDASNNVLGMMLFGRHKVSMNTEVNRRATDEFNKRQAVIAGKDTKMKGKWYVPSAYRKHQTQKATNANFAQQTLDQAETPGSIDTDDHSPIMKNFGVVNNNAGGSILLMGSSNWNLTINDCWLLGAVHSQLPFYPASSVSKANVYDPKFILSITGRELFGLAISGYRHVVSGFEALGSVFTVAEASKARGATLKGYQEAMDSLTPKIAQDAFKNAGFNIAQVGL